MAPFSLETYEQARPWAKSIARAVSSRDMPPFAAEGPIGYFIDDARLTESEIQTIIEWTETPKRYNPLTVVVPASVEGDITVKFIDPSYSDGTEHWFYVPMIPVGGGFTEDTPISDIFWDTVLPIHHAALFMAPKTALLQSLETDRTRSSDIPGAVPIPRSRFSPGDTVSGSPDGHVTTIPKDYTLIAAIHFAPIKNIINVDKEIRVKLKRGTGTELPPAFTFNAINEIKELFPGRNERKIAFNVTERMLIHSAWAHMHELGESVIVKLNGKVIFSIADYNADWQLDYSFAEPIEVCSGDVLECIFVWQNTTHKIVRHGSSIKDEMGIVELLWVKYD